MLIISRSRPSARIRSLGGVAAVVSFMLLAGCVPAPSGPHPGAPPVDGPGATPAAPAEVRTTRDGKGAEEYFIYEPVAPGLSSAPVIVFLHGYSGVNPLVYGAWIRHLVQRGNIVIYPVYQTSLRSPERYTAAALAAVQAAFDTLDHSDHVRPDRERFALVGHSLGAVLALNIAAVAVAEGLPRPGAVLAANAGDTTSEASLLIPSIQSGSYGGVPAEMLFLGVVGAADDYVGPTIVLQLYDKLGHLPQENREVVVLYSDDYGFPQMVADHHDPLAFDRGFDSGAPLTLLPEGRFLHGPDLPTDRAGIDNHDYYGYWKWLDGLTDAAFYGVHREFALGGGAAQLYLGTWEDGMPVIPAERIRPSSAAAAQ